MGLGDVIRNVVDVLKGGQQAPDEDTSVRPASEDPLGDPGEQPQAQAVRPASEDPRGDPADQAEQVDGENIRPASEDPLGDPADQAEGETVRPASEDPRGDPADRSQAQEGKASRPNRILMYLQEPRYQQESADAAETRARRGSQIHGLPLSR
jgi:hypothetical protein